MTWVRSDLTVEQIQEIFDAGFVRNLRISNVFNQTLDRLKNKPTKMPDSETEDIHKKMIHAASRSMAEQLHANDRSTQLFTFEKVEPFLRDEFTASFDSDWTEAERFVVLDFMLHVIKHHMDEVVGHLEEEYEEAWRKVSIVRGLMEEHHISAAEVLNTDVYCDEVARRMFSRDEYMSWHRERLHRFLNVDKLLSSLVKTTVTLLQHKGEYVDPESLLADLRSFVKSEIQRMRAIGYQKLLEDVARIYTPDA